MRTFEEPPFEKEANIIVDRWLDVSDNLIDEKFYCITITLSFSIASLVFLMSLQNSKELMVKVFNNIKV